jgi:hypothetical protein
VDFDSIALETPAKLEVLIMGLSHFLDGICTQDVWLRIDVVLDSSRDNI